VQQAVGDRLDQTRQPFGVHRQGLAPRCCPTLEQGGELALVGADLAGVLRPLARVAHQEQVEFLGQQLLRARGGAQQVPHGATDAAQLLMQ
jgi:hypothetical protein